MSVMKKALIVPGAVLALALSVSACGSDSKDAPEAKGATSAAASPSPSSELEKKLGEDGAGSIQGNQTMNPQQAKMATKFVECMRKLGYDMPEPSAPGFNFSPKDANSMDAQKLQKLRKDSAQCSQQAGGGALTGG